MHLPITIITTIFSLLLLSAAQNPRCIVNQPIILGLPRPFVATVQNASFPSIHNRNIAFLPYPVGSEPGNRVVVSRRPGAPAYLKFSGGKLSSDGNPSYPGVSVWVEQVWRAVRFQPANQWPELVIEGHYGCDDNGKEQIELVPMSGGPTALGFCVVQDRAGTYDLAVKPRFEVGNACIEVTLATASQQGL